MNILNDIKAAYNKANIVERIVYINAFLFLVTALLSNFIIEWFALPSNIDSFITKPWTLLSYGFIHQRFIHLISNLLVLYYIGNLFLDFYTKKQFLNFYFLGLFVGGIAFLTTYYFTQQNGLPLAGASAAIATVFVAIATKVPRYALRLRFIGSVELWVLAAIYVSLNILQLTNNDNGGAIAHLSGALLGFVYSKQLSQGNDIGKWFENSIDFFTNLFTNKKNSNLKTVHKSKRRSSTKNEVSKNKQGKINDILDKISKSGYDSLTQKEKDFLFRAGRK
ncbi:Membrane associated serine protease, rhomboid family [Lutibacter oricola]|uniref:Membrane associated serine protease, rhomboid family n=1 Tax=Lutibacter oricola TaxID=762486 RepID=A0A1H3F1Y9_9FLAO|nr:rhomboid family intramembrane serine protease [Lutibacter oricola]SDX84338.1 Membrane associated serine protease, rhomboid family [Lutibacter oricola]